MDRILSRAVNVAIVVVAAFLLYGQLRPAPAGAGKQYPAGTAIDMAKLGGGHGAGDGPALLLVTRSTCHYCTESMPFYSSLNGTVPLIGVAVEDPALNDKYLTEHGVNFARIVDVQQSGLSISTTPVLILVDAKGRVVDSWWGKPDAAKQAEILAKLKGV